MDNCHSVFAFGACSDANLSDVVGHCYPQSRHPRLLFLVGVTCVLAGPFFIRLAWHCAGSYDKNDNTGGSNGATMRFPPEADHGGNAGLGIARNLLEPIKAKHPSTHASPSLPHSSWTIFIKR